MTNKQVQKVVVKTNSGAVDAGQVAVILSRATGDEVCWVSQCDQMVRIVFASNEGSPFASRYFEVPGPGQFNSGPLVDREEGKVNVYKYSIMGADANNDPIIIVKD